MANNDDKAKIKTGTLKKLASIIQSNSDDIYKSTYYSDPSNKKMLKDLKTDIDSSIKDILNSNTDFTGQPNISRLYERMFMNQQNDKGTINSFERIFGDNEFINDLTSSYLDNMWIRAIDKEIDDVVKYMPKLEEALKVIRDNVLSSDSFSKDFLSLSNELSSDDKSIEQFNTNISDLKETYDLLEFVNDIYYDTSKYGETFVYCVPYAKAIQNLLDTKRSISNINIKSNFKENKIYTESVVDGFENVLNTNTIDFNKADTDNIDDIDINVSYNSGIIESIVSKAKEINEQLEKVSKQSVWEQYVTEAATIAGNTKSVYDNSIEDEVINGKLPIHHNFDKTLHDELELPDIDDTTADGLVTDQKQNNTKIKNISGCILKKLRRDRITPILINDICLGYYYFEFDNEDQFYDSKYPSSSMMMNTITGLRSNGNNNEFDAIQRRDDLVKYLASELSEHIDAKFVNDNQDLKKEIYYILKYNDNFCNSLNKNNIRVTYIPPDDIHHIYFKLNENTHRGISDLELALVPAKLFVAIYVTNCLGIMTRGNDKRVYYVKQNVETNISKTLLKTINEIKKANFGIRQLDTINNVLNITGRFNDYIIPRGSDGQSPIEFEMMPGQQIEIKTDLLNLLEEAAINSTDVPIELIQSRQSPEYATQLTMSNSKFLRCVYSKQSIFEKKLEPLFTKLYDVEYGSNDKVSVMLPPPLFINVTNTNQLITNTSDFCNSITEIILGDSQDDILKAKFSKKLKIYHLGSYLNMNAINDILNKAQQEVALEKIAAEVDNDAGGDAY